MDDELTFGELLRQTRERKGLDLNETARRLRIRPDILRAIEAGNFSAMPPRGYARNMVTGYARYLGLNPTEVTGMYLSDLADYENGITASRRRSTGFDMSEAPENTRFPHRSATSRFSLQGRHDEVERSGKNRGLREASLGEGLPSSTSLQGASRSRGRSRSDGQYGYPQSRKGTPKVALSSSFIGQDSDEGSGALGSVRSKLPFIVAAVVVLVIVILVCILLFGGKGSTETSAVSTMPVTGLSDAGSSQAADSSSSSSTSKSQTTAPTEGTFTFTVADGGSTYIEVYADDATELADDVSGPSTKTYTFKDTLKFVCVQPDSVTATLNGEPVTLEENSKGIVSVTYQFSDILESWQKENGSSTSSSTTSASSSASASSSSSKSSSSSSSKSSSTKSSG